MTLNSAAIILGIGLALALPAQAQGRCWTSTDYVDLYFRQFNGQVPLPHLRSPEQKALFEHLIDPCNLTQIVEQPVADEEKLRQLRIILASLGNFRAAYEVAVMVGEPLEHELAAVQAFSLQAAEAELSIDRLAPNREGSTAAWVTLVAGVLDSIGNTERYTPRQAILMADAVTRYYPAISVALGEADRQRLRAKVLNLAPKSEDAGFLRAIARMKEGVAALP